MSNLDEARQNIEAIDKQMAALFEQRMKQSKTIAEYKKERGLSIKDKSREGKLIEKNRKYIENHDIETYYVQFMKSVMNISCDYQDKIISGVKVAYCGVAGAYAHIACTRLFPDAQYISYPNFREAYEAVEKGQAELAVLPIENSYAGEVGNVMDLMFSGSLYVNQVTKLKIEHNLLAKEGVTTKDIKTVVSHAQAIHQCDTFLRGHSYTTVECANTAMAAKMVSESDDPTVAAIASEEAAKEYGLKILKKGIHDSKNNTTRFAVFSRVPNVPAPMKNKFDENFILLFTVRNIPGALAQALNIIGSHGFNMKSLRSRPMKNLQWSYYFYIEAEGHVNCEEGDDMMRELQAICAELKLVGSYVGDDKE